MLDFRNKPPADGRGHSLPLRRTPAQKPMTAIVTAEDLVGCSTHYWKGRTSPCLQDECDPCANGMPWRWHAYFSAWDPSVGLHFLFECTAQAADVFVRYREAHGTLRGCYYQARRSGHRDNGRVLIQTKPADLDKLKLPPPPNVIKALCIIWNLPETAISQPSKERQMDALRVISEATALKEGNGEASAARKVLDGHGFPAA